MKQFKFFQKYVIVGMGETVGVLCFNRQTYRQWFRRINQNECFVYENKHFKGGVNFQSISKSEDIRGAVFDHIISLDCFILNPDRFNLINESQHRIRNGI